MLGPLLILGFVVIFSGGVYLGARRFASRKRRAGEWDEDGPLNPSIPKPSWNGPYAAPYGGLKRAWERFNGFHPSSMTDLSEPPRRRKRKP